MSRKKEIQTPYVYKVLEEYGLKIEDTNKPKHKCYASSFKKPEIFSKIRRKEL